MIAFPNAKINLGLDILRVRPDGYHDISSVMIPVGWCDILEIIPANEGKDTLSLTGLEVDVSPERNLVMKAVKALREICPFPSVEMHLHKVIPSGAGLGGGSSDAAFTLKMLNIIFNLGRDKEDLARVASSLGSDCPFFIFNKPMEVTGTGTTMRPVTLSLPEGLHIAIVKPPVSVPTAQAYSRVVCGEPELSVAEIISTRDVESWQGILKNDFEPSVLPLYEDVARVKRRLQQMNPLYVSMSGSGSAVYAIFPHAIVAEELGELFFGCAVFAGSIPYYPSR